MTSLLWLAAAGLVIALYQDTFRWWWKAWTHESYYCTHGPLVPFVVGYLIWNRVRESDEEDDPHVASRRGAAVGWTIVGAALCLQLLSLRMGVWLTSGLSFVALCFGAIWAIWGREWAKALTVPVGFLVFMIPVPFVAAVLTAPLQARSASFATMIGGVLGIPVVREGLTLHLPNYSLEVAPSCSGVNSLFSLVPLAVLYASLQQASQLQKALLVLLAAPIALLANGARLVLTLVLAHAVSPQLAEGFFHTASGLVLFGLAMAGLVAAAQVILRSSAPTAAAMESSN